jgi:hypothetical protein
LFVGRDDTSHAVHGVDDEGFGGHGEGIVPDDVTKEGAGLEKIKL